MPQNKNAPWKYLGLVIALGVAIAIGWWLLSPLWINTQVNESFPTAPAPVSTEISAPVANQAQPTDVATTSNADMTMLSQGSFYGVIHDGSGQASVYQLADGSRILRLESFSVTNGPDLYVYLVPVDPVPDGVGSEIPGSVSLGRLKGNSGDQNYEIPADLDLSKFKSVAIWCKSFAVPFAAAPLATQ